MCAKAKAPKNNGKKKSGGKRGSYNSSLQSMLDIWNVLSTYASPDKPLTAGQIADLLEEENKPAEKPDVNRSYLQADSTDGSQITSKQRAQAAAAKKNTVEANPEEDEEEETYASAQTVERYLSNATDIVNTLYPHTVLREDGQPAIVHTYASGETLHAVLETPDGKVSWTGDMTAILMENRPNPIPYSSLTRMLPKLMNSFEYQKNISTKKRKTPVQPPISLAGVVAEERPGGRTVYIPAAKASENDELLGKKQSRTRRFFLESILSPAQWRILSDLILVYPYISKEQTEKYLSALKRLAPGVRNWSGQRYAHRAPTAVNFEHIHTLDDAIAKGRKVTVTYGKYALALDADNRWRPKLQPMPSNNGLMLVEPYAMMWSNGYYYLVCKDGDIMRNLRVDRIINVVSTTIPFDKDSSFDPYTYRDRSPVMYPGEPVLIRLRCHTDRISTLLDFFGTAILDFSKETNGYTDVTLKASEKGVRLFALQYADSVEVLDPVSLRDEVAKTLQHAASKYV